MDVAAPPQDPDRDRDPDRDPAAAPPPQPGGASALSVAHSTGIACADSVLRLLPALDTCPLDPCSFSRPEQVCVTSMDLRLRVDFPQRVLHGDVVLGARVHRLGARCLVLDTSRLDIRQVRDADTGAPLEYTLHEPQARLGSRLDVALPAYAGSAEHRVGITYVTSRRASALQWMRPEQTEGGRRPFLFSQCQSIHCRSIVPCQDTPAVKAPYWAEVRAPEQLTVLMSAERAGPPQPLPPGWVLHRYRQPRPVPSYLLALAVAELADVPLGPRSRLWAERPMLEKAANEFADTEAFLAAAEEICGPYVWGAYDILVLPPSFAYCAMENPSLTFVNPSLVTGDRSLVHVIAHEIAHSWTGNLVTNRSFEHFWLNEGFATFIERKILGRVEGAERRLFAAYRGLKDLESCVHYSGYNHPLTRLVTDLTYTRPEDALSLVPYEKGHTFLFYLETIVGGPDEFDKFIRAYVERFKFSSIDSIMFKEFFCSYFADQPRLDEIDWQAWLYEPGMPPVIPDYSCPLSDACCALTERWARWHGGDPSPFGPEDLANMSPVQVQEFLDQILARGAMPEYKLNAMGAAYALEAVENADTRFKWLALRLQSGQAEAAPAAAEFLRSSGRLKYVLFLYRALYAQEQTRQLALDTFRETRDAMMHATVAAVARELRLEDEVE